jgi:hypothetical protein
MSNVRHYMRFLGALAAVALLALLAYWEVSWRFEYIEAGHSMPSPAGGFVAQIRHLPESSDLPYGSGVFVR